MKREHTLSAADRRGQVLDGEAQCVDLRAFSPARFAAAGGRRSGRGRHQQASAVGEQW